MGVAKVAGDRLAPCCCLLALHRMARLAAFFSFVVARPRTWRADSTSVVVTVVRQGSAEVCAEVANRGWGAAAQRIRDRKDESVIGGNVGSHGTVNLINCSSKVTKHGFP